MDEKYDGHEFTQLENCSECGISQRDYAVSRSTNKPIKCIKADKTTYNLEETEWGLLKDEPCRFCHKTGCVLFRIDDSPMGKNQPQVVRCNSCGRNWEANSPLA